MDVKSKLRRLCPFTILKIEYTNLNVSSPYSRVFMVLTVVNVKRLSNYET